MSRQFQLSIPSMKCGHCAATIETALNDVECIHSVSIDLETKTARIDADSNINDIIAIIRSTGYEAEATE